MKFLLTALGAVALLFHPTAWALDDPPEAKAKPSPKAQFQAVLDEYQKAQAEFSREYSKAKTDEERSKLTREKSPNRAQYAERLLAVADAAPNDPAAVDALVLCVQLDFPGGIWATRAIDRLVPRHAEDPKIGTLVTRLADGEGNYGSKAEALLRAIAAKNPDHDTRGRATLILGRWLKSKVTLVRTFKGGDTVGTFVVPQGFDADAVAEEAEATFERVVKEFGDVNIGRGTLGKTAQGDLNEIRGLLDVGKPCPEIAGEDLDGKPFKLSDYKGKVVVVSFWGDWAVPFRAMHPFYRSLVKKREGKPFVLLVVNSDGDKDKLRARMKEENITWRSWWDGGDPNGPIASQFNIYRYPAFYLVDHRGIIRHKFRGLFNEKQVDSVLDPLIEAAVKDEAGGAKPPAD